MKKLFASKELKSAVRKAMSHTQRRQLDEGEIFTIRKIGVKVIITRSPKINHEIIRHEIKWQYCHDLHSHCESENDCRNCPYGIDHYYE